MANENENLALLNDFGFGTEFDFEEMEDGLTKQLEDMAFDLEVLEEERANIENPDSLGKTVLNQVWTEFGNQLGLDVTDETLIQKYDREHPEQYKDIKDSIMQAKEYKAAKEQMKSQLELGNLKDAYTGKDLTSEDKINLDHVVPRKEIFDRQRRKQANLEVADLANKKENLAPTNEALNKSKGAKSNREYVEKRTTRERDLIAQNNRKNEKINRSNKLELEKRLEKEKAQKSLNDRLAANDELMLQADKKARKAINRDIGVNARKQIGKKAGRDALKTMAIEALFSLLKEIVGGFVSFLKEKAKSFRSFLLKMKEAIHSFFSKIWNLVATGATTAVSTVASEIFGPVVSLFHKISSLIKQGITSIREAFQYLLDKNNKDKPLSIKVAQIGKIVVTGLTGGLAIFSGELFEKILLGIPGMQITIPFLGTLANVIGLFLGSLISGLIGAIVINLIEKFIAKKLKEENTFKQIEARNEILEKQGQLLNVSQADLAVTIQNTASSIKERHQEASAILKESLNTIFSNEEEIDDFDAEMDEMYRLLDTLNS